MAISSFIGHDHNFSVCVKGFRLIGLIMKPKLLIYKFLWMTSSAFIKTLGNRGKKKLQSALIISNWVVWVTEQTKKKKNWVVQVISLLLKKEKNSHDG